MNNFEDLQHTWKNQPSLPVTENGFKSLLKKVRSIEQKQKIGNVVLLIIIIVLILFALYVSGYKNNTFLLGISLMIVSLILRIAIELYSLQKSKKLNFINDSNVFKEDLIRYYRFRKIVHYIFTPFIIIVYAVGFVILLPLFKATLSTGFYMYIVVSSVLLLLIFSVFIYKQIKNELHKLNELQVKD
jgi:uncharacterized membrane protein